MSQKARSRKMNPNRRHLSEVGMRDRQCPRCKVMLRSADFTDAGICLWCAWELSLPARVLQAKMLAGKTISGMESPAPSRSTT